jgi:hypothetical protein
LSRSDWHLIYCQAPAREKSSNNDLKVIGAR